MKENLQCWPIRPTVLLKHLSHTCITVRYAHSSLSTIVVGKIIMHTCVYVCVYFPATRGFENTSASQSSVVCDGLAFDLDGGTLCRRVRSYSRVSICSTCIGCIESVLLVLACASNQVESEKTNGFDVESLLPVEIDESGDPLGQISWDVVSISSARNNKQINCQATAI